MNTLPYFQTQGKDLSLMQTVWRSILNPLLGIPFLSGVQLSNISLVSSSPNVINTTLQRMQQGWFITDITGSATLYRSAPFNSLTLTLTASAPCTVSLWVF